MDYTFGLRGHDIGSNFQEMCENAKKHGVKKIQFALAKTVNDVNFDEVGFNEELAAKIKAKLDEYDLHVSVLGCYINPINRNSEELEVSLKRFENFIKYARVFGADMIATETGLLETLEETRSEENYQFFLSNVKRLVKKAEEENVMIAIEPVFITTVYSPAVLRRLIDDVNSPNLGALIDISNLTYPESRNDQCDTINDSFDLLGDKIKAIHLKDFTFDEENKKSFALAGSGELMTELIFDRMKELKKLPEIILDVTKVENYAETLEILADVLEG